MAAMARPVQAAFVGGEQLFFDMVIDWQVCMEFHMTCLIVLVDVDFFVILKLHILCICISFIWDISEHSPYCI